MDLTQLDFKKIMLWVVIWLVGYGLGLLEAWVKNRNKEKNQPEPEVQIIQAPPQLIEEDYALAIFENENEFSLKLDKAALNDPTALDELQRKRLISLVVKLRPWLEGKRAAPKPQGAPAQARPKPQPAPTPIPTPIAQAASTNIASQPIASAGDGYPVNLGMVEQIDWFLQKKLENHPLKAKNIRLSNALTGGVKFMVGDESYDFRDEIPDPAIRTLIEEATAEWEKKSTPGS